MLTILYRGYLASCNYACDYCPFAKRDDSRADLARDARALERFVEWSLARTAATRVFFTPWGEALIRRAYQRALVRLSNAPHVTRIAIQTNLSADLRFIDACDVSRLGLWCTFHPTQTKLERFVARCHYLSSAGVAYSVGIVGRLEHLPIVAELRRALPADVYLWVNSDRSVNYDATSLAALMAIDPLFSWNHSPRPSLGAPCATGHTVISVDGNGDVRRCHFVPDVIANIYRAGFEQALAPRPCSRIACTCHIGYVHRKDLPLAQLFGDGLLERRLPVLAQVSSSGAYSAGSSNPAIQAAAPWQRVVSGGTRNT